MYKNQKWTDEYIDFLFTLSDASKKDRLRLFKERFPESDFTINAISTKMCEVRATKKRNFACNRKPLYSEQIKKGYVRIKVAQPSVWWQKQKWVYVETHPYEWNDIEETDTFYFLDGNNRNFNPENIVRVKRKEQGPFQMCGGVVPGHPELTYQHLLQARLKLAQLDLGEKIGLVKNYGGGRRFKEDINEWARERRNKLKDTEKYQREWARRKRNEI